MSYWYFLYSFWSILFLGMQEQNKQLVSSQKMMEQANEVKVNQYDISGKRQGLWIIHVKERMGEPERMDMGYYEDGLRMGTWHSFNKFRALMASEQFVYDELNGPVRYYDDHGLICEGQYYGPGGLSEVDTMIMVHPITRMDTLVPVVQDMGSFRHGVWNYYNSMTKMLTKREYYQVGTLLKVEEVPLKEVMDSTFIEQRIQQLPHNQKGTKKQTRGRKSLIH